MCSSSQLDHDFLRILLYRKNGKELLLRHHSESFALPAIPIPRHSRAAQRITEAIRKDWKLDSCCLFPVGGRNSPAYAVELCGEVATHPAKTRWLPVDSLAERDFSEVQDFHAVDTATKHFDQYRSAGANSPFGKFGWLRDVIGWVESNATRLGVHLTGEFQQFNASATFSLIRFKTDGPALWFKAVGDPNLQEFRITLALVKLLPDYLPPLVASQEIWNAWVTIEAEGHILAEFTSDADWQKAALALASLQIGSFGNARHLMGAGCTDVRASVLLENIDSFFSSMTEVMTRQTKQSPPPLNHTELTTLAKRIREALEELMESEIPNVLGHLDCNPGNIVVSRDKCVFLDWAEGSIGHPFFTMQYLLEHSRKSRSTYGGETNEILSSYLTPWQSFADVRQIAADLALTPLLAAYAYASSMELRTNRESPSPEMAALLRSLARRMKREADTLQNRSVTCLP
jgi:Phosphotransferase enzyme family